MLIPLTSNLEAVGIVAGTVNAHHFGLGFGDSEFGSRHSQCSSL